MKNVVEFLKEKKQKEQEEKDLFKKMIRAEIIKIILLALGGFCTAFLLQNHLYILSVISFFALPLAFIIIFYLLAFIFEMIKNRN